MVLWFYGFMVLWFYGFMVLWFYGFMVLWFYGFLIALLGLTFIACGLCVTIYALPDFQFGLVVVTCIKKLYQPL